jgi:hypothetical protein
LKVTWKEKQEIACTRNSGATLPKAKEEALDPEKYRSIVGNNVPGYKIMVERL